MDFLRLIQFKEQEFIEDLQGLLRIDSVGVEMPDDPAAPYGIGVVEALNYMLLLAEQWGFKTKNIDNVAGYAEYGEGEERIDILVHLDVVPVGSGWRYGPFSGRIEDGKIYARGASDDKGPAMAALYALRLIKEAGIHLSKRFRIVFGTDEEKESRCLAHYLAVEGMPTAGFSPDAYFPLIYGEKGILSLRFENKNQYPFMIKSGDRLNMVPDQAELTGGSLDMAALETALTAAEWPFTLEHGGLTVSGVAAHALEPDKGKNAALGLVRAINTVYDDPALQFIERELGNSRMSDAFRYSDDVMGELTMNFATLEAKNSGLIAQINIRYPHTLPVDDFVARLTKRAQAAGLACSVLVNSPSHYVDPQSPLVLSLMEAYRKYTGDEENAPFTIGGGTYARHIPNAVAFGALFPGREEVFHEANEYAYLEDLLISAAIYAEAIINLNSNAQS